MSNKSKEIAMELKQNLLSKIEANIKANTKNEDAWLSNLRRKAMVEFDKLGFPTTKLEAWRKTNLKNTLERDYNVHAIEKQVNAEDSNSALMCSTNQYDTDLYTQLNGQWLKGAEGVTTYENGTIVCPMSIAINTFAELIEPHFGKYAIDADNAMTALNTADFSEGYFVYVPDNVEHDRSLQMVNLIDSKDSIFANMRNLVIVGKNSKLRMLHCDDSVSNNTSFINNITEINIADGAKLDFYKLQNKDNESSVVTSTFVKQGADSNFASNTIILNGGLVKNDTKVVLNGKGANADVIGLYLMDGHQFVDNHVHITHAVSNCTSNQLFKGIVDEHARSVFNGHTLVMKDAQQTIAYQNNNNIQLTKTSKIDTNPFLEIYADDVKCSHGATVGQLDNTAMFYIMQRGICERNAKMLLMLAFVGQVIDKIELPNLRASMSELVGKRLKGELSSCEQCSISCADPDKPIHFEIDMSLV